MKRYPKKQYKENRLDRPRSKCFILSVDDIVMSVRRRGAADAKVRKTHLCPFGDHRATTENISRPFDVPQRNTSSYLFTEPPMYINR